MKLSQQEVENVADLARLQVSESEKEQLSLHLSSILTYMEELNQVDTEGVSPMASVVSQAKPWKKSLPEIEVARHGLGRSPLPCCAGWWPLVRWSPLSKNNWDCPLP